MIEEQKGVWIAFEGNDGSGKSDQIKRFAEYLTHDLGIGPVIETREPGGCGFAEQIRALIFNPEVSQDPQTQLLLFTAARRRNILKTVKPALSKNSIVLSDRSEGSTLAYQYFQFGLNFKTVDFINDFATDGIKPDLTVLLDVDENVAMVRKGKDVLEQNHFDKAGLTAWQERRRGYLKLAKKPEKYGLNPWVVVDANNTKEQVFNDIVEAVKKSGLITGL